MPEYIASMSAFQVRQMTGPFAPTNGFATIASVTPDEWLKSDPGNGLPYVIDAWCGGGKGKGTKLVVHGGGHNNSANNGVYIFEFSGTSRPTGWTLPSISSVSAVQQGSVSNSYRDGRPVSTHTNSGMVSTGKALYRFLGAHWNSSGGFTAACWKYSYASNAWTYLGNYGGKLNQPLCVFDESANKILITTDTYDTYQILDCATDRLSAVKSHNFDVGYGSTLVYDSLRRRVIEIGPNRRVWTMDWNSETLSGGTYTPTGAIAGANLTAACSLYDESKDVFWIFGGRLGDPGYSTIYEMNARTFAVTAHPLSQSIAISISPDYQGAWDRYIWMHEWRAIGFVSNVGVAPVVIKVPA
jgi:hypothetical protein